MLRKFAAALLATTLIAGTAVAAQSAAMPAAAPASTAAKSAGQTAVMPVKAVKAVKTGKIAVHMAKHARKHFAGRKAGTMHQARHVKPATPHQASVAISAKRS